MSLPVATLVAWAWPASAELLAQWDLFHNAFLGGLAIALTCSLLSVFVVTKRMAFVGEGIAHAGFGGMGVALLAEAALDVFWPDLAGALGLAAHPELFRYAVIAVFCVSTAVAIGYLSRKGRLSEDTAIGICLVAAMAVGLILRDLRAYWVADLAQSGRLGGGQISYVPSFEAILFGNILLLSQIEMLLAAALAAVVLVLTIGLFKELVFFAFDEETATVFGVRTRLLYYGLLVFLGLAVVMAMRGVGVVLAAALLILPGASARYWSARIGVVTVISAALGVLGMAAGMALTLWAGRFSPGGIIVLTLVALFVASYIIGGLLRRRRRT